MHRFNEHQNGMNKKPTTKTSKSKKKILHSHAHTFKMYNHNKMKKKKMLKIDDQKGDGNLFSGLWAHKRNKN